MKAKNPHAVALGRLRKGIKERPSARKSESSRRNMAKARAARIALWLARWRGTHGTIDTQTPKLK